jgi:hypothetical protein
MKRVALRACALVMVLVGCGCQERKNASLSHVGRTLAVGSYQPFTIMDACQAGDNFGSHCTTETVTAVDITSSADDVLTVLDSAATPAEVGAMAGTPVLFAKEPGRSRLSVTAQFSDGSTRQVEQEVEVRRVTRVEVESSCRNERRQELLLPVGGTATLKLRLFDGDVPLEGLAVEALAGAGVSFAGGVAPLLFKWTPTVAGEVTLRSSVVDEPPVKLRAVADSDITIESLAPPGTPPHRVFLNAPTVANVVQSAGGKTLCDTQRMLLKSETPEICTGPDGELEWETGASNAVVFKQLKAGTCRLSAGTEGGTRRTFDLACVAM